MKKIFVFPLLFTLLSLLSCGGDDEITDENNKDLENSTTEIAVTASASNIKAVSAVLKGYINSNIPEEDRLGVTNYGFVVSNNSNPNKQNGWIVKGNNLKDSKFSVRITNLAPMKQYYYVSYFYDGTKYYYGQVLTFTTEKFESSDLQTEAIAGETSVNFKGCVNFEKVGYFSSFKLGFHVIDKATIYSRDITSVSESYTYTTELKNISSETEYSYYFFIEYLDNYNTKQILKGGNDNFTTSLALEYGAVDLGLSVLWNGVNLGADSPDKYGDFFAWGEVSSKSIYSSENYLYTGVSIGTETDPGWPSKTKFYDITNTDYDAAHKILGDGWHMPSIEQVKELIDNCKWKYISYKGTSGFLVTGDNGNRIFLPAAGRWQDETHQNVSTYTYLWAGNGETDKYALTGKLCRALSASYSVAGLSKSAGQVFDAYYGFNISPVKDK